MLYVQIIYVDFVIYELLDQHRLFEASLLDGLDNLKVVAQHGWQLVTIVCSHCRLS